jgi:hypothetical protein
LVARFFLQQRKSTSSIERSRTLYKDNRANVVAQPINEPGNKVKFIGVGIVSFELVDELGETIHILNDRGCLADIIELAEDKLMLVSAETFMDQGIEAGPVEILEKMFDGLEPAARCTLELHGGTTNPNNRIHEVHLEVCLGLSDPELSIIAKEGWEVEFRKLASRHMGR